MGRPRLHFEGDICETQDCDNFVAGCGSHSGVPRYRGICSTCHRMRYIKPWLRFRKGSCESCGHTPLFSWALEVHHRDGDKTNNEASNLTTLCANCHRDLTALINQLEGDWGKSESIFKRLIRSKFG